jgi:hypothetical protein
MRIWNPYKETFTEDSLADDPRSFNSIALECQLVLLAWIGYAIEPSKKINRRSSYEIKHDFEHVGFPVTNGIFKGAMLASGYKPKERRDQMWYYAIQPRSRNAPMVPGEWWYGSMSTQRNEAFLLSHLTYQQRRTFDEMVKLARISLR